MSKVEIKQEDNYDWAFENEEAWESYLEDISEEVSEERLNKIIKLKEKQNG